MTTSPGNQGSPVAPLKQRLTDDMKAAMKARDRTRLSVVRLALAAINNAEIARQAPLNDGDILGVIAKEIRQRRESIEAFCQGNRPELAAQEEAEMVVLQGYQPQQLSREEIAAAARRVIEAVGARGSADKGKVMGPLMAQLKGQADGREINAVVTELLAA